MKTKLSLLIIEISDRPQNNGVIPLRVLVDKNNNLISQYLSTKSVDDTISEMLSKYSNNLDTRYCRVDLADFFHDASSDECEVLYMVKMPYHLISPTKESKLLNMDDANIGEKYGRSIQRTARSV